MKQVTLGVALLAALVLCLSACGAPAPQPISSAKNTEKPVNPPSGAKNEPDKPKTDGPVKFMRADSSTFTIADIPGKVKVVNVWATWCAPCIGEMPELNLLAAKYKSQGVTFVAVSVDENGPDDVEPALKRGRPRIDFDVAYASFDDLAAIDVAPPIPDTLVFDQNGKLVQHFDKIIEKDELEAAIKQALGGSTK